MYRYICSSRYDITHYYEIWSYEPLLMGQMWGILNWAGVDPRSLGKKFRVSGGKCNDHV